jgi:hypothetical protein
MEYWSIDKNRKSLTLALSLLHRSSTPIPCLRELLDKKTLLVYFNLLSFWRIS